FLPGPYRVPGYRGRARGVATNKAPLGPYRGVGRPPAVFVIEGLMDRAARQLGLDPTEIRLRNFVRDEEFPYKSPSGIVWDRSSFTASLRRACEALDDAAVRAEQARARAEGRWLGAPAFSPGAPCTRRCSQSPATSSRPTPPTSS